LTDVERKWHDELVGNSATPGTVPAFPDRDVREEVIDVIDLHAQQVMSRTRMREDQQRAARARQRPHLTRPGEGSRSLPELLRRLTHPRDEHPSSRATGAA